MDIIEKVAELLGIICGLAMRIIDLITGKRKDWHDGI
jgi:hypothetical protein